MLTFSILWFTFWMHKIDIRTNPHHLVLFAMILDTFIFCFIASTSSGGCI